MSHPYPEDKKEAKRWAYNRVHSDEQWYILDTETTGLDDAEIVDICVLNKYGQPLLDTLIKPTIPIPSMSTEIHNISNEMVVNAPTFPDIYPKLKELLSGKKVVIYNSGFDCMILRYCCRLHDLPEIEFQPECAMLWYAQYYGQWHDYYGNYTWRKLPGGGEHRALADCKATYHLLQKMAEVDYDELVPKTPDRLFPPVQIACKWEVFGLLELRILGKHGLRRVLKLDIKLPVFYWMKEEVASEKL